MSLLNVIGWAIVIGIIFSPFVVLLLDNDKQGALWYLFLASLYLATIAGGVLLIHL